MKNKKPSLNIYFADERSAVKACAMWCLKQTERFSNEKTFSNFSTSKFFYLKIKKSWRHAEKNTNFKSRFYISDIF